ncbi:MAG: NAD-dependent epimerase/dehydratase family protein [Deltaproteobacteria bacterium]|nr:MAG: NAD-dependent epimerase/dehydratase family protein [Deltaproteobacteria bacterium]
MPKKKSSQTAKSSPPAPAIALTGTAGFVGSQLLKALEEDPRYSKIIAIDYRKPPFETKKTKFYRFDLTETLADAKLLEIFEKENVDTVIHAAFPVSPPRDLTWAHELVSVGTMYVLDACAAKKIRKLISVSTTELYGAYPTNPNFLSEKHALRGGFKSKFLRDRVDADNQVISFAKKHPETVVTLLRPCTILGPNVNHYKTDFLQRIVIVTVLGYDPLFQCIHEDDVTRAFKLAIEKDFPGTFNLVGDGVLPLSRVLHLSGKLSVPLPGPLLYPVVNLLWALDIINAPGSRLDFLKYLCVADGEKAKKIMGFQPKYSTKETLLSFIGAQRLKQAHLDDLRLVVNR